LTPEVLLLYSFLYGLLHGLLPDEHTWPITFSYAVGGASGKQGLLAGFYFSLAFTIQRALVSQVAYFALAPFLMNEGVNAYVYMAVGLAMSAAGGLLLYRTKLARLTRRMHRHGRIHDLAEAEIEAALEKANGPKVTPVKWTLVHGFLAGYGFEGFSIFINVTAAPKMPSPLMGFLPGMLFGLGTMVVLMVLGTMFGAVLRWAKSMSQEEIARIGSETAARTLFYGGLLFVGFGALTLRGLTKHLPIKLDEGYILIGLFMLVIAIPAFIYSWRQVRVAQRAGAAAEGHPSG
jgi:ABC-type nickel/cobalt efflux system permease component RcnA